MFLLTLHVIESYAGVYIPYITKAILSTSNPPVKLAKIAIGDGAIGDIAVFSIIPTVSAALEQINIRPIFRDS